MQQPTLKMQPMGFVDMQMENIRTTTNLKLLECIYDIQ